MRQLGLCRSSDCRKGSRTRHQRRHRTPLDARALEEDEVAWLSGVKGGGVQRWPEPRTSHDLERGADQGHQDPSSRDTGVPREPEGDKAPEVRRRRRCAGMDDQPRYCYLLSTALVFLEEEGMVQQSSVSISLSF